MSKSFLTWSHQKQSDTPNPKPKSWNFQPRSLKALVFYIKLHHLPFVQLLAWLPVKVRAIGAPTIYSHIQLLEKFPLLLLWLSIFVAIVLKRLPEQSPKHAHPRVLRNQKCSEPFRTVPRQESEPDACIFLCKFWCKFSWFMLTKESFIFERVRVLGRRWVRVLLQDTLTVIPASYQVFWEAELNKTMTKSWYGQEYGSYYFSNVLFYINMKLHKITLCFMIHKRWCKFK